MKEIKIQNLLAPTWKERLKTEKALLDALMMENNYEEVEIWGEDIQEEISLLKPTSVIFLSALIAFWADVSEKTYIDRMKEFGKLSEDYSSASWASPYLSQFPMTPKELPNIGMIMPGIMLWTFISKLGDKFCKMIEPQLVACLRHPESMVNGCAEEALASMKTICDKSFIKYYNFLVEKHGNAELFAKHVTKERLDLVLKDLKPNTDIKINSSVIFYIVQHLNSDLAKIACQYLRGKLADAWSDEQLSDLIYTFSKQLKIIEFNQEELDYIESLSKHGDEKVRSAVAKFLSKLNPALFLQTLSNLSKDSHPWVLMSLCRGLKEHKNLPEELVKETLSRSLGNFDGYDGEPNDSAVELLVQMGNDVKIYIDEIKKWLDKTLEEVYLEHNVITNVLDVIDNLGENALGLKDQLKKLLDRFIKEDQYEECPSLDSPNAVIEIKKKMKQDMIKSGKTDEEANNVAEFQGALLDVFAKNLDPFQAGIDDIDVKYNNEMRENFGDDWDEDYEDSSDEEYDDDYEDEEADEIIRLRAKINELSKEEYEV